MKTRNSGYFTNSPSELYHVVKALPDNITHVIIDEVQKVPKLLDSVQRLMKEKKRHFIMTGSSARKLKRGGANLLAGRAFVYHLFPFSFLELLDDFNLDQALRWGTLPEIFECSNEQEKLGFLMSYANTYLREEVIVEQLVRNLDPFRKFLQIAAQSNGKIINYANLARDVKVDAKTVKTYFQILEDTLIGFFIEPFHQSVRKRQSEKPKFYFFDTGVVRALAKLLSVPLSAGNNAYENAFEHFIMTEAFRLGSYYQPEYNFFHIRTQAGVEVDLVIERPGKATLLIEIKSSKQVISERLTNLRHISKDTPNSEAMCLSNDPYAKDMDGVKLFPWQLGLKRIFVDDAEL